MSHKLTEAIKAKGWKSKDVAARWGILPHSLSIVARNPKQKDWDAVAGLPLKGKHND
jgi:hypothetical protein